MTSAADTLPLHQILVVDDDVQLREQFARYLMKHGYGAYQAGDAVEMDAILAMTSIDLVVLDIMLPGEGGLSICRRLTETAGPAIIIVSAMAEEVDRIIGLELGADDYVIKPCSPRELLARIRAVMRRRDEVRGAGPPRGKIRRFEGIALDEPRRELSAPNGTVLGLTPGEYLLLSAFLQNPHVILSRDQLFAAAGGGPDGKFDRVIDVQISRLRRKLHACADRQIIRTCRGAGYLFDAVVT